MGRGQVCRGHGGHAGSAPRKQWQAPRLWPGPAHTGRVLSELHTERQTWAAQAAAAGSVTEPGPTTMLSPHVCPRDAATKPCSQLPPCSWSWTLHPPRALDSEGGPHAAHTALSSHDPHDPPTPCLVPTTSHNPAHTTPGPHGPPRPGPHHARLPRPPMPPDGAELLLLAQGWMESAPSGQNTPGGQRPCPVEH